MESCCGEGQEKVSLLSFVCNIIFFFTAVKTDYRSEHKVFLQMDLELTCTCRTQITYRGCRRVWRGAWDYSVAVGRLTDRSTGTHIAKRSSISSSVQ